MITEAIIKAAEYTANPFLWRMSEWGRRDSRAVFFSDHERELIIRNRNTLEKEMGLQEALPITPDLRRLLSSGHLSQRELYLCRDGRVVLITLSEITQPLPCLCAGHLQLHLCDTLFKCGVLSGRIIFRNYNRLILARRICDRLGRYGEMIPSYMEPRRYRIWLAALSRECEKMRIEERIFSL